MKNNIEKFIEQIKKYHLEQIIEEKVYKKTNTISNKQINNFNSLMINPKDIPFPKSLLLNNNLLNCDDYLKRVEAMCKINNWDFPGYLLCEQEFLNSKNYYEDMDTICKIPSIRFIIHALINPTFINSPYHKEDLERMIKLLNQEDFVSFEELRLDAIKAVASNKESIESPYHREDMNIIETAKLSSLQYPNSLPGYGLNHLAVNQESLKDKRHLKNMEILAENPISKKQLFRIMTNNEFINGKYYDKEIEILKDADSEIKAIALYYYMINLNNKNVGSYTNYDRYDFDEDLRLCKSYDNDYILTCKMKDMNNMSGKESKNYLFNLDLLKDIDDEHVLYISSLLSNKDFDSSKYQIEDIENICCLYDKELLETIFYLVNDPVFINSPYHSEDLQKVIYTQEENRRNLLYEAAINQDSIESPYHEQDMNYILSLDLENLDNDIYDKISFYLFEIQGINHPNHIENLERLKHGEEEIIDTNNIYEVLKSNLEKEENNNILMKIKKLIRKK